MMIRIEVIINYYFVYCNALPSAFALSVLHSTLVFRSLKYIKLNKKVRSVCSTNDTYITLALNIM